MQQQVLCLGIFSFPSMLVAFFSERFNSIYNVRMLPGTIKVHQFFAARDHHLMIFSKSVYLKTDLWSHSLTDFQIFFMNQIVFQANSDSIWQVHLLLIFILKKLNYKICSVTFY